jgi:hypothetical protein
VTTPGEFKYVVGWFTVFVKDNIIVRLGPFETEEQAKQEREKQTGVKKD